jgi:hypothetical protein
MHRLLALALLLAGCGEPPPAVDKLAIDAALSVDGECMARCVAAAQDACDPLTGVTINQCACGDGGMIRLGFGCFDAQPLTNGI